MTKFLQAKRKADDLSIKYKMNIYLIKLCTHYDFIKETEYTNQNYIYKAKFSGTV